MLRRCRLFRAHGVQHVGKQDEPYGGCDCGDDQYDEDDREPALFGRCVIRSAYLLLFEDARVSDEQDEEEQQQQTQRHGCKADPIIPCLQRFHARGQGFDFDGQGRFFIFKRRNLRLLCRLFVLKLRNLSGQTFRVARQGGLFALERRDLCAQAFDFQFQRGHRLSGTFSRFQDP